MLKLFKYEGYKVVISPEAFALEPFRLIWNRDRTVNKDKAIPELGYIYFFYDPRSDYTYITDEKERHETILKDQGFPKNWKPDDLLNKAIQLYVSFKTTSSLLLEDTRCAVDKLRKEIRAINLSEKDSNGKPIYTLQNITGTIKLIPSLSKDLAEAERALNIELVELTRPKGGGEKTLFEDDLGI